MVMKIALKLEYGWRDVWFLCYDLCLCYYLSMLRDSITFVKFM